MYSQMLAGSITQNPALKNNILTFPLLFQVDLEPEGKVFVVITLTGSFTEGRGIILACFHWELGSGVCSCHQLPSSTQADDILYAGHVLLHAGDFLSDEGNLEGAIPNGSRCACPLLCCCSDLRPRELTHAWSGLFIWNCPSNGLVLSLGLFTWVPLEGQAKKHVEHV